MFTLQVKVKPNSRQSSFFLQHDGVWHARLKSQPVDGKANKELIALVASEFKCAKRNISIKSGSASRLKTVLVDIDES